MTLNTRPIGLSVRSCPTREPRTSAVARTTAAQLLRGDVEEVSRGFIIRSTGEWIAHERVIWRSPDGGWWRCADQKNGVKRAGETRCLIGPPRGV
jgi:hypothetical protein